jgi:hypothetical protein
MRRRNDIRRPRDHIDGALPEGRAVTLPTPYTVQREPFQAGAQDPLGNPVKAWGPPEPVLVHGWGPPSPDSRSGEPARDDVERDLDIYAPAGTPGGPRDRWTLDGVPYEQVGYDEDFTRGPWQWAAGVRISVLRSEG